MDHAMNSAGDAGREAERPAFSGGLRSSPARRGLTLAAGFWLVITLLLGARVAMFDEIAAARVAEMVTTRLASLTAALR